MSEAPEKIWAWSYVDADHGNCHWNTGEWYLEEDTDLDGDEREYTRSDLALAAQGALLEKIASWHDELANHDQSGLVYSSLVGIPISNADELDLSVRTHEWCATETRSLSPDAAEALEDVKREAWNAALAEAATICAEYEETFERREANGAAHGAALCFKAIQALITTG